MTGLEALDKLVKQIELDEDADYWEIRNAHNIVEKELQALEIIKKKQISIWRFRNRVFGYEQKQNGNNVNDTYEYYTNCFGYYHDGFEFELLTEEEFNLLKEVLK